MELEAVRGRTVRRRLRRAFRRGRLRNAYHEGYKDGSEDTGFAALCSGVVIGAGSIGLVWALVAWIF